MNFAYYRFDNLRRGFLGLPAWTRPVLLLFALPGLVLAALSLLALGVSILVLLALTVPVYRLLSVLTVGASSQGFEATVVSDVPPSEPPKHVEAKVIE